MHRVKVRVVEDALDANNTIARANRDDFDRHDVTVVNLMSAPGAGKTSLLERVLETPLGDGIRVGVLEGDVQGSYDATRIASLHVPVTQINTGSGFGGECHLDANMVRTALPDVPLADIDLLVIENVGNLVCPAEFRVGEDVRVMVAAITEGEDKPLKYPLMYRTCELVLINKVDLLPHLEVDLEELLANIDAVHPDVETMVVSARTGRGRRGLAALAGRARRAARAARRPRERDRRPTRPRCCSTGRSPHAAARERRAVRARGAAHRRALPRRGRALRARRAPAGLRVLAGGCLGRPPRRGRVRAPGDRGQARAAGARAAGRGRCAGRRGRAAGARARTSCSRSGRRPIGPPGGGARRGRASRAASPLAFAPLGADWVVDPPTTDPFVRQELVETDLPHRLGALARLLRPPRAARRAHRAPAHDAGASSFLYPFLDESETDLAGVLADVRASVAMKAARDRAAARADRARGRRGDRGRGRRRCGASSRPAGRCSRSATAGSATDAMDVVADFTRPLPGGGGAPRRALDLAPIPRSSPRSPTTSARRPCSRARSSPTAARATP